MPEKFSRRDLLVGVLATGTLSAAATYFVPGGRRLSSIELNLVTGQDKTGARDLLVDMWNRANPDTQVKVKEEGADSTLDQQNGMISAVDDGNADILNLDTIHIRHFADTGRIIPQELDGVNKFVPAALAASLSVPGSSSGQYWATPYNTDVGMLFERLPADPGATENQQLSLSGIVDGLTDRSGAFAGQLKPSASDKEAFVVNVPEHALSRNENIIDTDGNPAWELEYWRAALEPLRTAVSQGRMYLCDTENITRDTFKEHRLPYMRNWPVEYRRLQQSGDVDVKAARVRVRSLPVGILGGQSLAIVKKSKKASRAADFIRYMTGVPAQKVVAAHGLVPTRIDPYTDENLTAFVPHLRELRAAVGQARPRPMHANYIQFSSAVAKHVGDFLSNRSPELPSQFIYDMQEALK